MIAAWNIECFAPGVFKTGENLIYRSFRFWVVTTFKYDTWQDFRWSMESWTRKKNIYQTLIAFAISLK